MDTLEPNGRGADGGLGGANTSVEGEDGQGYQDPDTLANDNGGGGGGGTGRIRINCQEDVTLSGTVSPARDTEAFSSGSPPVETF